MDTRAIAIISVFGALTIVLTRFFIPAPYFPILFYELWEIPIVAVFFLISPKYGFLTLAINTLVAFIFFPAFSTPGLSPIYSFIACSSMLSGALIAYKLNANNMKEGSFKKRILISSTALGIILRVIVMTCVVYISFVWIIGNPAPVIIASLPFIAIFNITLPLYTIPFGYLLAKTVNKKLKINNKF
jgi:riboflavin transporter FmnP